MSFSHTSRNIVLDGTILRAECEDKDGLWKRSHFHLNTVLGNDNGSFRWLGRDYQDSADNIRLKDNFLCAQLLSIQGEPQFDVVDLNEHITNRDGELTFLQSEGVYSRIGQSETAEGVFVAVDEITGASEEEEEEEKRRDIVYAFEANVKRGAADAIFGKEPMHEYIPLSKPRSIRLVKIAPFDDSPDLIHCSLEEFSLDAAPPFAALSYTWGSPFSSSSPEIVQHYRERMAISCNGKRMSVGQNLYEALLRLRQPHFDEPREEEYNKTELIEKAESGSFLDVERLLRQGADLSARDMFGETALHYAAENGHILVVKALVYAGSDVNALDNLERKPLDCAREKRRGFWSQVEKFLVQYQHRNHRIHREDSCLRGQVTHYGYYWIDAICINQNDDAEKSMQVAMMGEIYSKAATVVVWLGPTYEGWQDPTLELLQGVWTLEGARVNGQIEDDVLDRMLGLFDNPNPYDVTTPVDDVDHVSSAVKDWINTFDGNALFDGWLLGPPLFRRSWFSRAWILQEVFMAQNITVACGLFLIPWDILIFMSSFIEGMRSSFRHKTADQKRVIGALLVSERIEPAPAVELERRKRLFKSQGKLPTLNALSLTRNAQATDPRDKVFSALSFSAMSPSTAHRSSLTEPNYKQTAIELYIHVARALLEAYGICVLSLAGMRSEIGCPDLPSWAPDLQVPLHAWPTGLVPDSSSQTAQDEAESTLSRCLVGGQMTKFFRVTPDNELFVAGLVWDTITELSQPGLNDVGRTLEDLESWVALVSSVESSAAERREILWRTLIEDRSNSDSVLEAARTSMTEEFRDWLVFMCYTAIFDLRDYLRACVQDFDYPDIREAAMPAILADNGQRAKSTFTKTQTLFSALDLPFFPNDSAPTWARIFHPDEEFSEEDLSEESEVWKFWEKMAPQAEAFGNALRNTDTTRRLMRTESKNAIGTAPEMAQVGDKICIIHGARVPYVLREGDDGKYQLIGEAYVYRLDIPKMLGSVQGENRVDTICIV